MTNRSALALAFTTGYVLGRVKKFRLPLGVGATVVARRLGVDPGRLGEQVKAKSPRLAELPDRLRNNARGVGRAATDGLGSLSGGLQDRTRGVREQLGKGPKALWKNGPDAGGSDGAGESAESAPEEKETPGSRKAGGGGGTKKAAARRPQAKKTAGSAGKRTTGTAKKAAGTAKKSTGTAKKSTGAARKTAGAAKRAGGTRRG
ncbi:MAG TPA: hypothetical protein VE546_15220 [Streptomyces sp.]|uniref:hypothetical protein n=1 Tax=Streptomyces sp. TaxID=1931 RepID=UPI002D459023|nr:hypothetical protein [Streptomyces sp.]HZG04896.1 hypothetical protein [Streptomyces sp.]